MRIALFIALPLLAACKKTEAVKQTLDDMKKGDTAPARYAETLVDDVRKAQAARDTANAAIKQGQDNLGEALKGSEGR